MGAEKGIAVLSHSAGRGQGGIKREGPGRQGSIPTGNG